MRGDAGFVYGTFSMEDHTLVLEFRNTTDCIGGILLARYEIDMGTSSEPVVGKRIPVSRLDLHITPKWDYSGTIKSISLSESLSNLDLSPNNDLLFIRTKDSDHMISENVTDSTIMFTTSDQFGKECQYPLSTRFAYFGGKEGHGSYNVSFISTFYNTTELCFAETNTFTPWSSESYLNATYSCPVFDYENCYPYSSVNYLMKNRSEAFELYNSSTQNLLSKPGILVEIDVGVDAFFPNESFSEGGGQVTNISSFCRTLVMEENHDHSSYASFIRCREYEDKCIWDECDYARIDNLDFVEYTFEVDSENEQCKELRDDSFFLAEWIFDDTAENLTISKASIIKFYESVFMGCKMQENGDGSFDITKLECYEHPATGLWVLNSTHYYDLKCENKTGFSEIFNVHERFQAGENDHLSNLNLRGFCVKDLSYDFRCNRTCYNKSRYEENICSGHGECVDLDDCVCEEGYFGDECDVFSCGGFAQNDLDNVCLGHGVCSGRDICECDRQYYFDEVTIFCFHCPNGTHYDFTGASDITQCAQCQSGKYSTIETDGCIDCDEGTYSSSNRTKCDDCPLGTYNPNKGMDGISDCLPCDRGYYGPSKRITSRFGCTPCPMGTYNPNERSTSIDDCIVCGNGKECPIGSKAEFYLSGDEVDNIIQYFDKGVDLGDVEDVPMSFKITVIGVCFFVCFMVLSCCFGFDFINCLSFSTCSCCFSFSKSIILPKKKTEEEEEEEEEEVEKKTSIIFRIRKKIVFRFQNLDCCYDMNHDIREGEGPIRKKTKFGACYSVIAISLALCFIIWSVSDFVYGSKRVNVRANFYQANETNQIRGTMTYFVDFFGDFEGNCSHSSSYVDGFEIPNSSFSCSTKYGDDDDSVVQKVGCACLYICEECVVMRSNLIIRFKLDHNGEFVRMLKFGVVLPSFGNENFGFNGQFYEPNGTVDAVSIDMTLYPRRYSSQSNWNLLLGLLDMERFGSNNMDGIGSGILSKNVERADNLAVEEYPGFVQVDFNIKISSFEQQIDDYFPQTLLNFFAQMFSLIGVSVSIVGIFFSRTVGCQERGTGCMKLFRFCCFCSFFVSSSPKIGDNNEQEGKEKNGDEQSINGGKDGRSRLDILEQKFEDLERLIRENLGLEIEKKKLDEDNNEERDNMEYEKNVEIQKMGEKIMNFDDENDDDGGDDTSSDDDDDGGDDTSSDEAKDWKIMNYSGPEIIDNYEVVEHIETIQTSTNETNNAVEEFDEDKSEM